MHSLLILYSGSDGIRRIFPYDKIKALMHSIAV